MRSFSANKKRANKRLRPNCYRRDFQPSLASTGVVSGPHFSDPQASEAEALDSKINASIARNIHSFEALFVL